MELQLDATITVFIDLLDQLNMFRANICPSSWSSIFTLHTLMMHGQTQIMLIINLFL
jgi:hypothetical protein